MLGPASPRCDVPDGLCLAESGVMSVAYGFADARALEDFMVSGALVGKITVLSEVTRNAAVVERRGGWTRSRSRRSRRRRSTWMGRRGG